MVTIKGKVSPIGGSYMIIIPKALVDCGVLEKGEKVEFVLKEKKQLEICRKSTFLWNFAPFSENFAPKMVVS